MWCVGKLTAEYRRRMYALLDLYARPLPPTELLLCVDEKSKQLLAHSRAPLPMRPGTPVREDYEYERRGTRNLFVAVEPRVGRRTVMVTARRTKDDFVAFIQHLLEKVYPQARRIHLVLDNLNTHFRVVFEEILGKHRARRLLRRVEFHHTPKHASWLNMAEIEIAALSRQCLDRRLPDEATLIREVKAWQKQRNIQRRTIEWTFTRQDADRKLGKHYVSSLTC
jgi:DDE superfamily endonuclease